MLSSRLVRPLARVVGIPARRIGGAAGKLAEGNAQRNPGRTAATAAALMIGIALVTFISVLAQGLRVSNSDAIERQIQADLIVTSQDGYSEFPAAVGRRGRGVRRRRDGQQRPPGHRADRRRRSQPDRPRRARSTRSTTSAGRRARTRCSRSWAPTARCCRTTSPRTRDLAVGDSFTVRSTDNETKEFVVRGDLRGQPVLPAARHREHLAGRRSTSSTSARATASRSSTSPATPTAAKPGVESALEGFPDTRVQTRPEWIEKEDTEIQQFLLLLYVLLALSVIISLFGMVNTLALSVFERTRELGMLRAVGMTRRQTRRMIRHESVITALIGAALGLPLGIFLAALVTRALGQYDLRFDLPVGAADRARDRGRLRRPPGGDHAGAARREARPAAGAPVRMIPTHAPTGDRYGRSR